MSDEERAARGTRPLPAPPDEGLGAPEGDGVLPEALGEPLVCIHAAVARAQPAMAKELPPEAVAATAADPYGMGASEEAREPYPYAC
ncbi:MAG: hypothetical protein M3N33_07290 [Actinomycetota bacterium]|nr:hypothetical protein [Actinomycetota bacterium]